MTPTPEQQNILDRFADEPALLIIAGPGCGKSETIKMMVNSLPSHLYPQICCTAFNKDAVADLKKKLPASVKVQTLNALGHGIWTKFREGSVSLNDNKMKDILFDIRDDGRWSLDYDEMVDLRSLCSMAKSQGYLPKGCGAVNRDAPSIKQLCDMADIKFQHHFEPILELALSKSIKLAYAGKGEIDFDDQAYMSAFFVPSISYPKYQYLFVDEAQDQSPVQLLICKRLKADHTIMVGDPLQCHPAGTLIRKGSEVIPIELIDIGDRITTYDTHGSCFIGVENGYDAVTNKIEKHFEGIMHTVTIGGDSAQMTFNHRVLARINPDKRNWYCVYLMQKGDNFRVGMCSLYYESGGGAFGPAARARQEGADAVWILSTHPTQQDALANEAMISAVYNIPDLMFKNNGSTSIDQERLDFVWSKIGCNGTKARTLLTELLLDIAYPIWNSWNSVGVKQGTKFSSKSFVTPVCNIFPDVMQMLYMAEWDRNGQVWLQPQIDKEWRSCTVYGITVEPRPDGKRLYLANDIVVHNSIYAFRGSMSNAFERIILTYPDAVQLPLQTSFRLPKAVMPLLNEHNPNLRTAKSDHGSSHVITGTSSLSSILGSTGLLTPRTSAILCRNNAPLIRAALACVASNIRFTLANTAFLTGLVRDIKRATRNPESEPATRLVSLLRQHWGEPEDPKAREMISDKLAAISNLIEITSARTAASVILTLASLNRRPNHSDASHPIYLSTAHRAKGLEFDWVLHLDPHLIPAKFARTSEELKQEANIEYVINSRTKHTLLFCRSEQILITGAPSGKPRPAIHQDQEL